MPIGGPHFSPVRPGDDITAKDENQIRTFLNSLANLLNANGGMEAMRVAGMILMQRPQIAPQYFLAQVTAQQLDTSVFTQAFSGTTTNGSTSVTGIISSYTAQLQVGMVVTGTNIVSSPPTTITAITSTTITLSQNANGSGSTTITAAMYLYTWAEATWETTATGVSITMTNGRSGSPTANQAFELNNQHLDTTVPFYVAMRYRGPVNGKAVFDFAAPGGIESVEYTTLQVVTSVCAQFLAGPLPVSDGGTGGNGGNFDPEFLYLLEILMG